MFNIRLVLIAILALLPAVTFGQLRFEPPQDQGLQFPDTPVDEQSILGLTVIAIPVNDVQQLVQIRSNLNEFIVNPVEFMIEAGMPVNVQVTFRPDEERDYRGFLVVTAISPDGRAFSYEIAMNGSGVVEGAPQIAVQPEEVQLTVDEEGGEDEARFTIANVGNAPLHFEIIDPEIDWLDVPEIEGELEPDAERSVTVSTTDELPENGRYEEQIIITSNDPDNEEVSIGVILTVDIPGNVERTIQLDRRWNMISSNIDFSDQYIDEEGPDLRLILNDIYDFVILFKDGYGRFCVPEFDFWGIPFWNTAQGYLIKVEMACDFVLVGDPIPVDREMEFVVGWNMIAYYPNDEDRMDQIFESLVERDLLILAKNGNGQFYAPEWGVGGNIVVHPGEGLLIKVADPCTFRYPAE